MRMWVVEKLEAFSTWYYYRQPSNPPDYIPIKIPLLSLWADNLAWWIKPKTSHKDGSVSDSKFRN